MSSLVWSREAGGRCRRWEQIGQGSRKVRHKEPWHLEYHGLGGMTSPAVRLPLKSEKEIFNGKDKEAIKRSFLT